MHVWMRGLQERHPQGHDGVLQESAGNGAALGEFAIAIRESLY